MLHIIPYKPGKIACLEAIKSMVANREYLLCGFRQALKGRPKCNCICKLQLLLVILCNYSFLLDAVSRFVNDGEHWTVNNFTKRDVSNYFRVCIAWYQICHCWETTLIGSARTFIWLKLYGKIATVGLCI